jgi:site-specific DNA-methyltransferase (adenine-specific)
MAISHTLFSSRSEEWATPGDLFGRLDAEFHFTLDPCATRQNAKCRKFFDRKTNGLTQDWSNERVFMNPPYGRLVGQWMRKARKAAKGGALVVCLIHARTDTRWWHENVEGQANEVRFIRGRVRFERPQGLPSVSAPFPSALVVYRPHMSRDRVRVRRTCSSQACVGGKPRADS